MCGWFFFFFKQKTAYEMRISDWSSDVCSSDLEQRFHRRREGRGRGCPGDRRRHQEDAGGAAGMGEREVDGDAAALGAADERRLVDVEPVQHRQQVVDVGEGLSLSARLAEAAAVVGDDAMAWRELVELRLPHAAVGDAG